MASTIKKIGVVGAGTMGRGIAQVFALHGYPVVLFDRSGEILSAAIEKIRQRTEPEAWPEARGLIETSIDLEKAASCDLVIEAVFEDAGVKKEVFRKLSMHCRRDAIIATNTSAISINELSDSVEERSRFIGMHFMNPPKVMRLVEVIRGDRTSEETVDAVLKLAVSIGKVTAVAKDSPGFISNRLLFALIGEALRLLEAGIAGKEDIDTVMKYGMSHPMGPIELADFIGLDVCLEIMGYLYTALGDDRYRPTARLEALVKAGRLGRKTGEGFYKYE